jgi:hypothetical protein
VHDAYSASDCASDSASYSDSVSSFNKKSEATEADSFDGQMWLLRIAACYPNDSNSGGSPAESMAFIGAIEQESKRQGFKSPNDAARYLLERVALHAKAFASYPQADRKYIPNLSTFLDPEQRRYFRDPKERGSNGSSKAEQNEQQSRDAIANAARRFVERRQAAGAADVLGAEPVQQNNY